MAQTVDAQPSGAQNAPANAVQNADGQTTDTQTAAQKKAAASAAARKQTSSEKQTTELNAVNVTGIAGSQARDIVLKRYSDQMQDSITAQNIGQLPDTDVADALQRITGVQINRSAGQGTTVSVRGISQVKTTLNGEEYLNAGGDDQYNRPLIGTGQADFEAVDSSLVKGLDVLKSTTASDLAGGISGIININTYRPFDFKKDGWTFSGSAKGYEGDRVKKFNKGGSALAAWHNDTWGFLLEGSYSDESLADYAPGVGNAGIRATEQKVGSDFNGDGVLGNSQDPNVFPRDYYYAWNNQSFGNQFSERKRTGLHSSFQYKFSDALQLIGDADYSKYQNDVQIQNLGLQTHNAVFVEPGAVVSPNGVLQQGTIGFASLNQHSQTDTSTAKAINTNLELRYDDGGVFSGSLRWVHQHTFRSLYEADIDSTVNRDNDIVLPDGTKQSYNPNGFPLTYASVNTTGKYPSYNIITDVSNPANWLAASSWGNANKIDIGSNIYRADGMFHFDGGAFDSLEFGARYQSKDYRYDAYKYESPVTPPGFCDDKTAPGPKNPLYYFRDGQITDGCTGFSEAKGYGFNQLPAGYTGLISDFGPLSVTGTNLAGGIPAINPSAMKNPKAFLDSLSPGEALYRDPSISYLTREKIVSLYSQLNSSGEIEFTGGTPYSANFGIRVVRTTLNIGSYATDSSQYLGNGGSYNGVLINQGSVNSKSQYTSWLPAFNVAFDVTPDQKLRFAAAKTEARQDLAILSQGFAASYYSNGNPPRYPDQPQDLQVFNAAGQGNPALKPFTSKNYNASYAWYFNPQSIVYVGAFLMQVGSFPQGVTIHADLPDADGVVRAGGPLTTYKNGGAALIRGVEGEFRTQFTALPGFLSGFGTQLNYTYAQTGKTGLAHNQYNAIAFYQKYGLELRLAYNWRGKNFDSGNSSLGEQLNIYSKPVGYLDASINYKVNDNVSVFLQGTNLTDSFDNQYFQYPGATYYQNISERRYYAGVRLSF
ncbi:MAG: TonB-dependent receptor [Rhodanobacter sp.]